MSEQANERPAPQMDSAIATPPLTGYNLVWRLASPFLGLILKWRSLKGKENPHRIGERFGRYEHNPIPPGAIWLHAVLL